MSARVLCVDDEPRVLEGLELQLGWDYEVHLADGGAEGLEVLEREGPFAVVISDMRMPGMNGAEFLAQVRQRHPDTTRMLLTGHAEVDAAANAINQGRIFRYLQKPCSKNELLCAVDAAIEHHQLVCAERSLLEDTLNGAVNMLTELLSITAPLAFSRAAHIRAYTQHVVAKLTIENAWEFEVAAMLAQLGCVTVPPQTLERMFARQPLNSEEEAMIASVPKLGSELIAHIPRLGDAAKMIAMQAEPHDHVSTAPVTEDERIAFGAALLGVAVALDSHVMFGKTVGDGIAILRRQGHPAPILDALADFRASRSDMVVRAVKASQLQPFMVLDEDVVATNGAIVVPRERELSAALLERLKNFASGVGLVEPIRVRIPVSAVDRFEAA